MDPVRHGGGPGQAAAVSDIMGEFRSFSWPSRLLMINQFGINLGFYMLMPYLAGYLAGPLGLAAWAVGLVLGIRNFSQQGMFIVGGTLSDRLGYKPLIVAGCLLRTGGFALLVVAQSLPMVLIASAATGFAGALFNPAVRAYLAAEAGERRIEVFAVFNVFYQAGILAGPLLGLAFMAVDFRLTAAGAAAVFALLTIAQLFALPRRAPAAADTASSVIQDWRTVVSNRSFLLFALAMVGCYVLSFQVYLALPLHAAVLSPGHASVVVAAIFVVSGVVAVAAQMRITRWFAARWGSGRALAIGMMVTALSFVPLLVVPDARFGGVVALAALLVTTAVLAVGSAAVFPFEMDTVVALAEGRLVGTHYGFYNTIVGMGILAGNLATGYVLQIARDHGATKLTWAALVAIGLLSAAALHALARNGHLQPVADRPAVSTGQ